MRALVVGEIVTLAAIVACLTVAVVIGGFNGAHLATAILVCALGCMVDAHAQRKASS